MQVEHIRLTLGCQTGKALGCQTVESISLSKLWFSDVNLHSYSAVISTIHQPSKEIFYMFDDMLLLQRGGWQTYFGPLGAKGVNLVTYLEVRRCRLTPPSG